ncbi:hypothetical protein [Chryseobacterium phocaeense]|uniref:hypothetical protein n=1 Tax=Chryseobacterium phocaeense TaxID=1816690 RepID=UPI0009BBE82B|nr:hypothetical protein [Chryseobacterium phocaeense]
MKTYVLLLFLLWMGMANGQQKKDTINLNNVLERLVKADKEYITTSESLVSTYTFTQLVKKDFSLLVTGSAENTQVGKYAALSVDRNEQSFAFSPINFIVNENNPTKPFRHVLAINASGKLNNNGFFDFSDRKKLQVGGSWTALWFSGYNFPTKFTPYLEIFDLAKDKVTGQFNSDKKFRDIQKKETDTVYYKKLYHQEAEKYENEAYKSIWTSKFLIWTKLDIGYAEDRLKIIDSINVQNSVVEPMTKGISGGYFSLSGNLFYGLRNGFGVYINAQLSYSKKTSLSEIFSTVEWNKVQYESGTNNTVYYDVEEQSVYIINMNTLKQKYKRDISVQILGFIPLGQNNLIGLDIGYQNKEFITPGTTTFTSNKNILSVGIMFPLRDKNGKTTINIEPFWRNTSFTNYDEGKEESFWGVKFGVPLNQLF